MPFFRTFQVQVPAPPEVPQSTPATMPPEVPQPPSATMPSETTAPTLSPMPNEVPELSNTELSIPVREIRPLYPADNSVTSYGLLSLNIANIADRFPVEDAQIQIFKENEQGTVPVEAVRTDSSGKTAPIELEAPPRSYSEEFGSPRPYSKYSVLVRARTYEPCSISGIEILPEVTALQEVQMLPLQSDAPGTAETFVIPEHTLYGNYPPKIEEEELKELSSSGEIVLSEVVIPEYVVVHDGTLSNKQAQDYYVPYKDYIKNVASSEIYATWPEATLYANVLAIQSFTLNRVYTEWYRNRGYSYTITSSTAYDQKWIPNRNIYDTISNVVDHIFNNYLTRPNVRQPLLAQYCDGRTATCPGVMSQWGSKYLGDEGYTAIEILRNYYGNNLFIKTTEQISGIPSSYPGTPLSIGSSGPDVSQIQKQLLAISKAFPIIPTLAVDGIFGVKTAASVSAFQNQFNLPVTGIVDFSTWYKISEIYVAVTKIAEYTR